MQNNNESIKVERKKYHPNATEKDKFLYKEIIKGLTAGTSVMDIHRKTGVARSTI